MSTISVLGSSAGLDEVDILDHFQSPSWSAQIEQLKAIHFYKEKSFKLAYTHQKIANCTFESQQSPYTEDSEVLLKMFLKEAVEEAKIKKGA